MMSYEVARYHWYRDHGICVDCTVTDAEKGRARCTACAAKRALYFRKIREKRVRDGLCPQCGKNRVLPGTMCSSCREYHRVYVAERRSKNGSYQG